ncbi:MAG: hypothetical protein ACYCVB_09950 [Bacilli bacterium]
MNGSRFGDPAEVVAQQIDDHHIFGAVLRGVQQTVCLVHIVFQPTAEIQIRRIRRPLRFCKGAVKSLIIAVKLRSQPHRVVDLIGFPLRDSHFYRPL